MTPQAPSARAGSVTFRAQNGGALQHEMLVARSDLAPAALPLKDGKDLDESRAEVVGETKKFDAG
ncbi:MAG: hypothetical protein EXR68_02430 [Dehalococcoidia bacterium]|nr:hypothetical protein [Dehalococcoidia bacterium]